MVRKTRVLHALAGNFTLLALVMLAITLTGGVDWWPPR